MSEAESRLQALARRRWQVALSLTAAMLIIYAGFILLIAFQKPLMGGVITGGLSWGILLAVLVIASAWLLTGLYVRWANRRYDVELSQLRDGGMQG